MNEQPSSQLLALVDIINRPGATLDEIREDFRHQIAPVSEKLKALHTVAESGTAMGSKGILTMLLDIMDSLGNGNLLEPYRGKVSLLLKDGCPDKEVLARMLWSMHRLHSP